MGSCVHALMLRSTWGWPREGMRGAPSSSRVTEVLPADKRHVAGRLPAKFNGLQKGLSKMSH